MSIFKPVTSILLALHISNLSYFNRVVDVSVLSKGKYKNLPGFGE